MEIGDGVRVKSAEYAEFKVTPWCTHSRRDRDRWREMRVLGYKTPFSGEKDTTNSLPNFLSCRIVLHPLSSRSRSMERNEGGKLGVKSRRRHRGRTCDGVGC